MGGGEGRERRAMADTGSDFLIVGAGIAGASAGYELAAHGRVVVLERESAPGYHSSGRAAGGFTLVDPNPVVAALAAASRPFIAAPPEGFAPHPLVRPRGVVTVARDDQAAAFEAALELNQAVLPGCREIAPAEAIRQVPVLDAGYVARAFVEHDTSDLDIHALHQGYLRGLKARGGDVIRDAGVERIERRAGRWSVSAGGGCFQAPVLIDAAGAWADRVAALAGAVPIGLVPKRRTVVVVDAPSAPDPGPWPEVMDAEEAFYFRPEAGRILVSPADQTPAEPADVQPEELDVATAVARLERATRVRVERLHATWAGLRSFVADGAPVVGSDPEVEGFFWLAGQGGTGLSTAPALSRATVALLGHGAWPAELERRGIGPGQLSPARLRVAPEERSGASLDGVLGAE
jgi:D-arginine dehydrogenase